MSKHDTVIRLQDMRDHAQEAVTLVHEHSRADLNADRVLSLALVRLLEGESSPLISLHSSRRLMKPLGQSHDHPRLPCHP